MPKNKNSIKNCLQLQHGDARQVAKITGFSYQYVRMVFCGVRHNQAIIDTARKLIDARENIKTEHINSKNK